MNNTELTTIFCVIPCLAFWLGVVCGLLYANFVWEERGSTKKQPRYGKTSYLPESKIHPFKRSKDMLTKDEE